jgi:ABC-type multidrug transport system ATPase subunit
MASVRWMCKQCQLQLGCMQMLQLINCADTIIGDGMTRGISGGERKRVTTGEIGPSKVLFMDEISTGLDSASTFTIVQSLANLAHATDATIIVSLLQPESHVRSCVRALLAFCLPAPIMLRYACGRA